jgi:hypothetical protein
LGEMPRKINDVVATSKLRVAGSNPAGVATHGTQSSVFYLTCLFQDRMQRSKRGMLKWEWGVEFMFRVATALALTLGLAHHAEAANILANGSFEAPGVGSSLAFDVGYFFPANYITGWTVTQGTVDLTGTNSVPAYQGGQAVDLIGNTFYSNQVQGALAQTFSTTIDQLYNLTFAYSNNYGATIGNGFSAQVDVTDSLANSLLSAVVSHESTTNSPEWKIFSASFVAKSILTTIKFTNLTGERSASVSDPYLNGGIYLDDVSVEAAAAPGETPLPGALPLFATGLGALALIASRRKRKQA